MLREAGLKVSGNKGELVERLLAAAAPVDAAADGGGGAAGGVDAERVESELTARDAAKAAADYDTAANPLIRSGAARH